MVLEIGVYLPKCVLEQNLFSQLPQELLVIYIDHRFSVGVTGISILCTVMHGTDITTAAVPGNCVNPAFLCLGL